jgi:phenylacetate-CoA ligase
MNSSLLKFYQSLPAPLRSLAASLRGCQLRAWRYSADTDRLMGEARQRETWTPEQWQAWQAERLGRLLQRAATTVPFHRRHWAERRARGDQSSLTELKHWPVLAKDTVRQDPAAFLAEDCDPKAMYHETTSGTTGTPLSIWQRREASREWYALIEARYRGWNGVSRHDRWAIIGVQKIVARDAKKPPFWVWNFGLNQLYLSALHIAPWSAPHYLEAIRRHRVKFIIGYSASLAYLAQAARERAAKFPDLQVILTHGEPLFDHQRAVIQEGFGVPVRQTYGMSEIAAGGSECQFGSLHLWADCGIVEILDERDQPVPPGQPGRIITTGLLNFDQPLIRYETRDMGMMAPAGTVCACGRSLPIIAKIMGRADDMVVTRDGRRLVQFDGFLGNNPRVKEGQVIQKTLDSFVVRIVPAAGWTDADAEEIRAGLRRVVGDVQVTVETTPLIERTWAGKFRVLVSELAKDETAAPPAVHQNGGTG